MYKKGDREPLSEVFLSPFVMLFALTALLFPRQPPPSPLPTASISTSANPHRSPSAFFSDFSGASRAFMLRLIFFLPHGTLQPWPRSPPSDLQARRRVVHMLSRDLRYMKQRIHARAPTQQKRQSLSCGPQSGYHIADCELLRRIIPGIHPGTSCSARSSCHEYP